MPGKYKENELAPVPELGEAVHKKPTDIPVGSYTETGLTAVVAMQLDRLGYRYGRDPSGEWVEDLAGEGKLLDGNGNSVPQSLKRSKQERDQLIGGTLLNGGVLYVYGSDELYPREMRVNAETGKLEISNPISEAPEAPSNPFADKEFLRRKRVFDQTHSKKQEDKIIQSSEYLQQKQEKRAEALAHNKEVRRRQIQAEAEQKAKAKVEPVKADDKKEEVIPGKAKKESSPKDPEMLANLFGVPKEKFTEDKKQEPEVKAEDAKEADKKAKAIPDEAKKEETKASEAKKDPKSPENLANLFGVPKETFAEDKKQEPEVKAEGAKAGDKKAEAIPSKVKKEEPKKTEPKKEESKEAQSKKESEKEGPKVPADLFNKSKGKDAEDKKQESDEKAEDAKAEDKKAEANSNPNPNPNPNSNPNSNDQKKNEPEKADPEMLKKYFSKSKEKAAEGKPEDAQKKEQAVSKEPKVTIVLKEEPKPEAKEEKTETAEKKEAETQTEKAEPAVKEAGLHFANTRRRLNRPIVVKTEEPTEEQWQDAEEDSRELLKGFQDLSDEKRTLAEDTMTELTANAIAAEEGLNRAISGNSGRPIDAKDAMENIMVSDMLSKRLENGDEKALEILTDPAKLALYRESLRETEFFKQNIAVPHTPEELRATYDGEKLKETEDLLSAETDSVMEKKEAELAKAAEILADPAKLKKAKQEEKARQEEIERNTPAKITPLEELYHGPKYEKPADKALDGTSRKALTDGMAATIWKDLGYQEEGKDLGDNRLLDYLAATGRLFDKNGKPIEGDIMRTNEKRENAFGKQLQDGESFFVYGKGEMYPREIRFNKQTGCLECDAPLDHRPEHPGPGASKEEIKEYQRRAFAYEHFSNKEPLEKAAEKAAFFDADLKKKLDERKAGIEKNAKLAEQGKFNEPKPEPAKSAAPKKNDYDPDQPMPDTKKYKENPKNSAEMTDRFAEAMAYSMGYEKEFRAVGGGTAPLDALMDQGAILTSDGSMVKVNPDGQGAWTPGHVSTAEEKRAAFFGAKLQKGESFFVYRKGEDYPREVKYDPQEKKIVVGEKIDKPPAKVPAPTTGQRLTGLFGRSKAVKNYEEYLKKQKLYEKFNSDEYKENRKKNDPYFKEKEAKAKYEQEKQQRQQQKELDKTENKKEYGPEFDKRVNERVDKIVAQYNKNHPDNPLNEVGQRNIATICRNYEAAQTDLSQGIVSGPNGSKTVQDTMAYKLMEKSMADPKNAHLLWDANNANYADNMVELAKNGSDYKYMTRSRKDMLTFCQVHLGNEKKLEKHAADLYREAKPVAEKVDKEWFKQQEAMQKSKEKTAEKSKEKTQQKTAENPPKTNQTEVKKSAAPVMS